MFWMICFIIASVELLRRLWLWEQMPAPAPVPAPMAPILLPPAPLPVHVPMAPMLMPPAPQEDIEDPAPNAGEDIEMINEEVLPHEGNDTDEINIVLPLQIEGTSTNEIERIEEVPDENEGIQDENTETAAGVPHNLRIHVLTTNSVVHMLITDTWIWRYLALGVSGGLAIGHTLSEIGGLLGLDEYLVRISHQILYNQRQFKGDDYCVYRDQRVFLYGSIIPFAGVIGSIVSLLSKRWGRRLALMAGDALLLSGIICMTWFPNVPVQIFGQVLAGLGIGILRQIIPILYEQTLPKAAHKLLSVVFSVSILAGAMSASTTNLVASYYHIWGWRASVGGAGIPGVAVFIIYFFLVEPPHTFIERGEFTKGEGVLRIIRQTPDVATEFQKLVDIININKQKKPLVEILKRKNRPVLVINLLATILTRFIGVEVLTFYSPFLLQSIGYKIHESFVGSLVLAGTQLISGVVGVFIIRRIGRKKAYLWASLIAFISLVSLGIIFHFNPNVHHHFSHTRDIIAIISTLSYFTASGILTGPLNWIDSSYPVECAEVGSAFGTGLNYLLTFIVNQYTPWMLCAFGSGAFFLYGFVTLLISCYTRCFVPETKGIKEHEMAEKVWAKHWFWKRYV